MTRDHADIDALLTPLAARGAPAGFAARLVERYAQIRAARARRRALAVCGASFALLAASALGLFVSFHGAAFSWHRWLIDGAALIGVAGHLVLHPLIHLLPELAMTTLVLAAVTAVCCVLLAAVVGSSPRAAQ